MLRALAAITSALVFAAGCSNMYVVPPPPASSWDAQPGQLAPRCTDSYLWPYVDGGLGAYFALGSGVMIKDIASGESDSVEEVVTAKSILGPALLVGITAAVYFGLSFWDGKAKVRNCVRYRDLRFPKEAESSSLETRP